MHKVISVSSFAMGVSQRLCQDIAVPLLPLVYLRGYKCSVQQIKGWKREQLKRAS